METGPLFAQMLACDPARYKVIVNQGGTSCFPASTLVQTSTGHKPICEIEAGQFVLSRNLLTGADEWRKVLEKYTYKAAQVRQNIVIFTMRNGAQIKCTEQHEFYFEGQWTEARELAKRAMAGCSGNRRGLPNKLTGTTNDHELQAYRAVQNNEACEESMRIPAHCSQNKWESEYGIVAPHCGLGLSSEPGTSAGGEPQELRQARQSCGEPGVGLSPGEYEPCCRVRKDSKQARFVQRYEQSDRRAGAGNKGQIPALCVHASDAGERVRNSGVYRKGHYQSTLASREITLQEITQVQVVPCTELVYDLCVEHNHNYTITSENLLVHNSSKTYTTMQLLLTRAARETDRTISVVGQDIPNLKKGAMRDAEKIIASSPEIASRIVSFNKSDRIYYFSTGSVVEFLSCTDMQSAKSGKRDYLFVNEANGIPYEIYKQLALRTYIQIYIDYNPDAEFWVHQRITPKPTTKLFITDHRHNPFLDQQTRDEIESLKDEDYQLWRVYARGFTGSIRGVILPKFSRCESIPEEAKLIGTGLDFGYVNDPTAVYELYQYRGELYAHQLIYEKGLKNPQIAQRLLDLGFNNKREIIADSAEKKSIDEINDFGLWLTPATKGPDSVAFGLDILQRFHIYATQSSDGILSEQPKYVYKKDKDGNTTNEPIDKFNHAIDACFTSDTLIDTESGRKKIVEIQVGDLVYTRKGLRKVTHFFDNGYREIFDFTLKFCNLELVVSATPDHKIYTTKGWKQLSKLLPGDVLCLSNTLMENVIGYTPDSDTSPEEQKKCTLRCGNFITGSYPKVGTYITRMGTRTTTQSKTLSACRRANTFRCTAKCAQKEKKQTLTGLDRLQNIGTVLSKAGNGTANTQKKRDLDKEHMVSLSAPCAMPTLRKRLLTPNSVQTIASPPIEENSGLTMLKKPALCAVPGSFQINTAKHHVAQTFVLQQIEKTAQRVEQVFDIEVFGEHEYFANGVLVHNCRYIAIHHLSHVVTKKKYTFASA